MSDHYMAVQPWQVLAQPSRVSTGTGRRVHGRHNESNTSETMDNRQRLETGKWRKNALSLDDRADRPVGTRL
jgi:hypothetical protein